MFNMTKADLQS